MLEEEKEYKNILSKVISSISSVDDTMIIIIPV
jgi:hypothetical protein